MIELIRESTKNYFNEYCIKYLDNNLYRNGFQGFLFRSATVGLNRDVRVSFYPRLNSSDLAFIFNQSILSKRPRIIKGSDYYEYDRFRLQFKYLIKRQEFHQLNYRLNSLIVNLR